jgi:hypothetical protein
MSTSLNLFFRKPLLVACLADAEDNACNARIIGTIEGAVGDQSGPWHALSMTHQGETVSTASWSAVMGNLISYSKGHEGDSFSVANRISGAEVAGSAPQTGVRHAPGHPLLMLRINSPCRYRDLPGAPAKPVCRSACAGASCGSLPVSKSPHAQRLRACAPMDWKGGA